MLDDIVTVNGTGIVDAITLSGFSKISWNETGKRLFNAEIGLKGNLEAIIDGETIKAASLWFKDEPFILEGGKKYTAQFSNGLSFMTSGDYYIITVGQLKRYFREQIPIESEGGISSWDEIFERVSQGSGLIFRNGGYVRIFDRDNGRMMGDENDVTEILLPYVNKPNNELILLETLEPLKIIPLEIKRVNVEWNGALEAKKIIRDSKNTPYSIFIDGKKYYPQEFTVYGSGAGEIHFRMGSYRGNRGNIIAPLNIRTPLTIEADYAKIGTGEIDLYRTERDGQVMHINSVTSEELKDCMVGIESAIDSAYSLALRENRLRELRNARVREKIGAAGSILVPTTLVASGATPGNEFISTLYISFALINLLIWGCLYSSSKDKANDLAKKIKTISHDRLQISYSGTQTSRWLEQHPEYLEFAKGMRNPEAL